MRLALSTSALIAAVALTGCSSGAEVFSADVLSSKLDLTVSGGAVRVEGEVEAELESYQTGPVDFWIDEMGVYLGRALLVPVTELRTHQTWPVHLADGGRAFVALSLSGSAPTTAPDAEAWLDEVGSESLRVGGRIYLSPLDEDHELQARHAACLVVDGEARPCD